MAVALFGINYDKRGFLVEGIIMVGSRIGRDFECDWTLVLRCYLEHS